MNNFYYNLLKTIDNSWKNNYTSNFDYNRFPNGPRIKTIREKVKDFFLRFGFIHKTYLTKMLIDFEAYFKNESEYFNQVYDLLNDKRSKEIMVNIVAYKLMSYKKIKLFDHEYFPKEIKRKLMSSESSDYLESDFPMFPKLFKQNLRCINKNIEMFYSVEGIYINYILEQYSYSRNGRKVQAEKGDIVIDAGGCWGDTALYFADKVGIKGQVYSFEFIPTNIRIFKENICLNPELKQRIHLEDKPVWSSSEIEMYCRDNGPGSCVSFEEKSGYDLRVSTISIDDFVKGHDLEKVDFIKMDIEGAELHALEGAKETIIKYLPKLAICVYHNGHKDMVMIPLWLNNLNLGYKFDIDHFTMNTEETVLFAKVEK